MTTTPGTTPISPSAAKTGGTPAEITTPDNVQTRIGALEFKDGAPSAATVEKVYDNLDFAHALNAYLNGFQIASIHAAREGLRSIGAADGNVVIFSELMDSQSLFLTANCDTIYAIAVADLRKGPVVIEAPPMALGTVNDMSFQWVIDMGLPGPDRGAGGKYLIVPPDYEGVLPESGYHVGRSRTNGALAFVRCFVDNGDPAPTAARIRQHMKVYPYAPGGYGTSVASILDGQAPLSSLAPAPEPPKTKFIEASGRAFNTIPASDVRLFEQIHAVVQEEPPTAFDPELMGQLGAIGIVKGQPFRPDARLQEILQDAAAVGNATARTLNFRFRERWAYYPRSAWSNMLFEGGHTFDTPPPLITKDGVEPFPPTGARTLDARTAFFYAYTGVTPGMIMRLTGVGSQYLMAFTDAGREYFDGGRSYELALPRGIPAKQFWSLTLYDNQTRSMLQTPQRFPRAGSQGYPTPAATADASGATILHIGPAQPAGVPAGNWIQTVPGKGWFTILRLYGPLPAFFDKSWRPSEIEEV
jgi:hypothetical protein